MMTDSNIKTIHPGDEVFDIPTNPGSTAGGISLLKPPPRKSLTLTDADLTSARLTPTCIVDELIYADMLIKPAPGGTGKTTLVLYEQIHIALGLPLYGLSIEKPGWTLFVTAEDRKEQLGARLRELMAAMELSCEQRAKVLARTSIWDVSGEFVKLVTTSSGQLVLTNLADDIVDAYKNDPPVLVTFDPIVSFGASELQVNDNEQALVMAARRIIRTLDCCVQYITHTGKSVARSKSLDQYTSRGGSALSDGARMVTVLQTYEDSDTDIKPPPGISLSNGSSVIILARPKLSYARSGLPLIWIKRTGYLFEYMFEIKQCVEQKERDTAIQVETFLSHQLKSNLKHTKHTLETALKGRVKRGDLRTALNTLTVENRVMTVDFPAAERKGGRKTYLATTSYLAKIKKDAGEVSEK